MLNNFSMKIKTKIIFGSGCISKIIDEISHFGADRILLVGDQGIRLSGKMDTIKSLLAEASYTIIDFDEIVPNPQSDDCEHGAQIALDNHVNLIIAVGGGSSMDTGKAIAAMAGHNTTNFCDVAYPNTYTCKPLPLICVPTTAGTGSEVTTCGVITDSVTHKKGYCYDADCAPEVALVDPEMLMSLPNSLAAATGMDALTHAIEGYVAKCTNHITAAYGLYAVKIINENIRNYVFNRDIDNATAMMIGSLMAGIAFGYSDTGCVHTLSETISKYYNIPHGVANAMFLPIVTEYNIPADEKRYADISEAMGVIDGTQTISERSHKLTGLLEQLVEDLEIPKLSDIDDVNVDDFDAIAIDCLEHLSVQSNPRQFHQDDFVKLLDAAYAK